MNYDLNKIKAEAVLMTFEANAKKRKQNPTVTVSLLSECELQEGDTFTGTNNTYTVGKINSRRQQNVSGRDLISFQCTT